VTPSNLNPKNQSVYQSVEFSETQRNRGTTSRKPRLAGPAAVPHSKPARGTCRCHSGQSVDFSVKTVKPAGNSMFLCVPLYHCEKKCSGTRFSRWNGGKPRMTGPPEVRSVVPLYFREYR
jgi:hypothetical protein